MKNQYDDNFSFYTQLWYFYEQNRGKIRSRYNGLTKKFLAYNDCNENPNAYLRQPQFEALEMYIFIKEFMNNKHVYKMFDEWRKNNGDFSIASYYAIDKSGQIDLIHEGTKEQMDIVFKQMKKYQEDYPNYIYALTMGLGKTILMATCIFYEFLLMNKYPKDKRFCHNALVFAPDKTVLQSLKEIMTFDKSLVVPHEYVSLLDANIKFHFLDNTDTILQTIDGSDFNIIISNTQKIIVKKKRKKLKPAEEFFDTTNSFLNEIYGENEDEILWDDSLLIDNQRFHKICRLPQLGVFVDEAHHLFGSDLEKQLHSKTINKTSLRDTINMLANSTSIVACYNYTGTPYVKNQLLPEVVYAYGLADSIRNGYLKDADPKGFKNVKDEEFINTTIKLFWNKYGGNLYEGLNPKLAIYASTVDEAINIVQPEVERTLTELNIPINKILVNVGDTKYTKDGDIYNFNNLDNVGSEGNEKQFIILVGKGTEGWNCRSLFGVAMFRSPKSKVFVLQATMRCLRAITEEKQTASIYLSEENYNILNKELYQNFNMDITTITRPPEDKKKYHVKVVPPPRKIKLKRVWHEYSLIEKDYSQPIDFSLLDTKLEKYERVMIEKTSLVGEKTGKTISIDELFKSTTYTEIMLVAEIARYLNISCILVQKILEESQDGITQVLEYVNKYEDILYDIIIPGIFKAIYDVKVEKISEDQEMILLREPENAGYYEFSAKDELVVTNKNPNLTSEMIEKSFHADTYCFDSRPEKECFWQYIDSEKVEEIYFTGMFTANQGDFSVYYYDPETGSCRQYYPDFLAKMKDGSYEIIEVKGDNMIDDEVVQAKAFAAEEMALASGMKYKMYAGSKLMKENVLDDTLEHIRKSPIFDLN